MLEAGAATAVCKTNWLWPINGSAISREAAVRQTSVIATAPSIAIAKALAILDSSGISEVNRPLLLDIALIHGKLYLALWEMGQQEEAATHLHEALDPGTFVEFRSRQCELPVGVSEELSRFWRTLG